MRYLIMLHAKAWSEQSVLSACQFCEAAIKQGHKIEAVFLYQDGATNALESLDIPSDELNGQAQLQSLHNKFGVPLWLCVTAAEKRSIHEHSLASAFKIAGLAEFAERSASADKVIQFK
jgi:tRNA 2-thiouridine synthesizing protein D